MVNLTSYLITVMKLIRWPNLLMIALTQTLIRFCIIIPVLKSVNMEPQLPALLFVLLVLATMLIAAGGYAINDYFDRKIDQINRPDDMVVGNIIGSRHAMAFHSVLTVAGIIIGSWVSVKTGQVYLSLLFFMVSGLLWFYSTTYKREFLTGSIIVSILTALVPFIVLLYELPLLAEKYGSPVKPITIVLMIWVLSFSSFAFLINLIREIIKDAEDFEGDETYGKKTIPIIWGMKISRYITLVITGIIIFLLSFGWFRYLHDRLTFFYFLLLIIIPLIYISYRIITSSGKRSFHQISNWLKIVMLTGLGYMIVANMIMNHIK